MYIISMPPLYTCTFLLLCLLAAGRFLSAGAAPSIVEQFEKWIVDNGRHYKDKAEKDARFKIFTSNVEFIDAFNRNRSNTFNLGVNQFADLTLQEYRKMVDMGPPPHKGSIGDVVTGFRHENVKVPENKDWRKKGGVTAAKNQGECNACWAFTAVALAETLNHEKTGRLLTLSEQEVLDCCKKSRGEPKDGCKGGNIEDAVTYIVNNKGIALAKDYPYIQIGIDPCDKRRVGHNAPLRGFRRGVSDNEALLKEYVFNTPVGVAMEVGSNEFEYFAGDNVWTFRGDCGRTLHSMALIGYGVQPDGTKYWLVKNSFGKLWGNNGFAKIAREAPGVGPAGICSIASYITIPS